MQAQAEITLANTAKQQLIRENLATLDAEGFNDATALWRIYGGAEKDSPAKFTRTESAKAIIGELDSKGQICPLKTTRGGSNPGTKMHPVLQLEYLRWLDSNFAVEHNTLGHAMASNATEQTYIEPTQTRQEIAANDLMRCWTPMQMMLQNLGFGKGAIKAEFLENALRKEAEYNVTLLSDAMRPRLLPKQKVASKTSKTTHVAMIELGGTGIKVTKLAEAHGVRAEDVNLAFVRLGWQYKAQGVWQPKYDGRKYCNVGTRIRGVLAGTEVIESWRESLVEPHLCTELAKMRKEGLIK